MLTQNAHQKPYNNFTIQAIEDFLYPLHTIFSYGTSRDSGALMSYDLSEGEWFNRYGEPITQPWFIYDSTVPWGFSLYNFNNDDIFQILVYYGGLHFGGPPAPTMYRFIDGKFRPVTLFNRIPRFFMDNAGRIVVHYFVEYGGVFAYYYLVFTEDGAYKKLITSPHFPDDWDSWLEHHQYTYFDYNPSIWGMPDETLTPILPLTELEEYIRANVMRRHGLEED